jgi:cytochrome o ubiquinol oxidase subunit 1
VAGIGALVLFAALGSLFVQLWVSIRDRDANRTPVGDPWDGRGLEWSIASPPPEYNFAVIPQVEGRDAFYTAKRESEPYRPHDLYEAIKVPRNSSLGPIIGIASGFAAFGLVWHMWWLAMVAMLIVVGAVIARSFARDVDRIIPAAEVEAIEARWLELASATPRVHRALETTPANRGLAAVSS